MSGLRVLGLAIAAVGLCWVSSTLAAGKVEFDLKFSGHTDCFNPEELENVPISIKGTGVLSTDGTARMDMRLTAYYIIGWKYHLQGRLGGPPEEIAMGVTGALKVLGENGLSLLIDFPETTYTTNVMTSGNKCGAELIARPKGGKGIYNLPAGDTMFQCNRFVVEKSSCVVR